MDVAKTRLQVLSQGTKGVRPSFMGVMRDIAAKDGIPGFYAGYVRRLQWQWASGC